MVSIYIYSTVQSAQLLAIVFSAGFILRVAGMGAVSINFTFVLSPYYANAALWRGNWRGVKCAMATAVSFECPLISDIPNFFTVLLPPLPLPLVLYPAPLHQYIPLCATYLYVPPCTLHDSLFSPPPLSIHYNQSPPLSATEPPTAACKSSE